MKMSLLIGLALLLSGCAAIYLGSPNQRWLPAPWRARLARFLGGLLLALGWLALTRDMQWLTTAFVSLTALMLFFSLLPYLGAFLDMRRKGRHV